MTCAPLWTGNTGRQIGSSPAIDPLAGPEGPSGPDGIVYIGGRDGNLYAFDATNGTPLWNEATGGTIDSAPAVANGVVYVGCSNLLEPPSGSQTCTASVFAFDDQTGGQLWSATANGTNTTVDNSPIIVDNPQSHVGFVFVGSSSAPRVPFDCFGNTPSNCTGQVSAFTLP